MSATPTSLGATTRADESLVRYDHPKLVNQIRGAVIKQTQVEAELNSILPPREWTAPDGALWVQHASSTPATGSDVIALQDQLNQKLAQREARENGICPIREELYSQCFDELIRQVTINCTERGRLLVRVRDEIGLTRETYRTLYESSVAFGMRRALQGEQRKMEMQAKVKMLEGEKKDLEKQLADVKARCDLMLKRENDHRADALARHEADVEYARRHNATLRAEMERQVAMPSKDREKELRANATLASLSAQLSVDRAPSTATGSPVKAAASS